MSPVLHGPVPVVDGIMRLLLEQCVLASITRNDVR